MAEHLQYLNDENFETEVSQGVTLVDFYADWCGPCKMMEPIIEDLAVEMEGKAKIAKIDIDSSQQSAATYNVTSIPTIILFKDGEEVQRIVGVKDKESLSETINSVL